ncbi:hypothetical protein LG293_17680 (plasmid) [Citricoccus nitrophenolicus]
MSTHDSTSRNRQPKGVSTGGQFATEAKGEPSNVIPLRRKEAAPDRPVSENLDHVHFNQPVIPDVLDRAERIRLPGYVNREVQNIVADGLMAAASTNDAGDFDYGRYQTTSMQHMADCLPTLGKSDIVAAVQEADMEEDPQLEDAARQLILTDQANRGLTHTYSPSGTVTHRERDAMYSAHTLGSQADLRPIVETAKMVREEIKQAKNGGYLPGDFTYGVRKEEFAGGAAIRVNVKGLTKDQLCEDDPQQPGFQVRTAAAIELDNRLEHILSIFNRDASDSMVDYFDVDFYSTVSFETID